MEHSPLFSRGHVEVLAAAQPVNTKNNYSLLIRANLSCEARESRIQMLWRLMSWRASLAVSGPVNLSKTILVLSWMSKDVFAVIRVLLKLFFVRFCSRSREMPRKMFWSRYLLLSL